MSELLADSDSGTIPASDKTKAFWQVKKLAVDKFLAVFEDASKSEGDLSDLARQNREEYLKSARVSWTSPARCCGSTVHTRDYAHLQIRDLSLP